MVWIQKLQNEEYVRAVIEALFAIADALDRIEKLLEGKVKE